MFIHPEISRELAQDRQREMLAHAQHRLMKNMLAKARPDGPQITRPGTYAAPLRLLRQAGEA